MAEAARPIEYMRASDFLAWYDTRPPGERYELLDGMVQTHGLSTMQAERIDHAETKARLLVSFRNQISARKLDCQALGDRMAIKVDDRNVFEPDALVRCGPRLPGEQTFVDDAVVVVEVLSPSSRRLDLVLKLSRYFANPALLHYLIVAEAEHVVIHHRRDGGRIVTATFERGNVRLDPPGLELSVEELFDDGA